MDVSWSSDYEKQKVKGFIIKEKELKFSAEDKITGSGFLLSFVTGKFGQYRNKIHEKQEKW